MSGKIALVKIEMVVIDSMVVSSELHLFAVAKTQDSETNGHG